MACGDFFRNQVRSLTGENQLVALAATILSLGLGLVLVVQWRPLTGSLVAIVVEVAKSSQRAALRWHLSKALGDQDSSGSQTRDFADWLGRQKWLRICIFEDKHYAVYIDSQLKSKGKVKTEISRQLQSMGQKIKVKVHVLQAGKFRHLAGLNVGGQIYFRKQGHSRSHLETLSSTIGLFRTCHGDKFIITSGHWSAINDRYFREKTMAPRTIIGRCVYRSVDRANDVAFIKIERDRASLFPGSNPILTSGTSHLIRKIYPGDAQAVLRSVTADHGKGAKVCVHTPRGTLTGRLMRRVIAKLPAIDLEGLAVSIRTGHVDAYEDGDSGSLVTSQPSTLPSCSRPSVDVIGLVSGVLDFANHTQRTCLLVVFPLGQQIEHFEQTCPLLPES